MAALSPTETREYNSTKTSYKSKYYDPEKAHEYYLKNRQLKGGHSTKGLSDETISGWSYAKENVASEKKQKLQAINAQYQAKVAEYREIAARRRKELSNQISEALAGIKDEAERKKEAERLKKQLEMAKINKSAEETERSAYTGVTGRSPGSNSGGKTDYDAIVKAYKEKHKKKVKK